MSGVAVVGAGKQYAMGVRYYVVPHCLGEVDNISVSFTETQEVINKFLIKVNWYNYFWFLYRELGIGIVPYSPLGRGFFTGGAKFIESLSENDFRKVCAYNTFLL